MDDPRQFLPLSTPQFQILLALTDADRHGYGIILDIEARSAGSVRLGTGTLYTALSGLVESDLIAESTQRTLPEDHDARRKYYRLTRLGRSVLEAETARLDGLVRDARRKGIRPVQGPAWSRSK